MDAEKLGAVEEREGVERRGADECVVGSSIEKFVYHRFAGERDEEWVVGEEDAEGGDLGEELVVVLEVFGEAETGVDDDVADAKVVELLQSLGEEEGDFL